MYPSSISQTHASSDDTHRDGSLDLSRCRSDVAADECVTRRMWARSSGLPGQQHGNRWPTPDQPFYALEHEQIPSALYRERVLMSGDGQNWTLLPPLPVSGASAERPGVLQALSALPDGRLAVWGPDPQGGIPASDSSTTLGQFPAFWVWLWDPTTQHWQVLPSPLKTPARESCGLCWQAHSAVGRDGASISLRRTPRCWPHWRDTARDVPHTVGAGRVKMACRWFVSVP